MIEAKIERLMAVIWNVSIVALLAVLGSVVVATTAYIRESRRTERARIQAVCPSGTAQRVIDLVNDEPTVRVCNRVADVVFGRVDRAPAARR